MKETDGGREGGREGGRKGGKGGREGGIKVRGRKGQEMERG